MILAAPKWIFQCENFSEMGVSFVQKCFCQAAHWKIYDCILIKWINCRETCLSLPVQMQWETTTPTNLDTNHLIEQNSSEANQVP